MADIDFGEQMDKALEGNFLQRYTKLLKEGIKVIQNGTSVKLQNEWKEEAERKAEALNSYLREFGILGDNVLSDDEEKMLMKNHRIYKLF